MSVIQPRTATVDIYQGDYLDRIRHLERLYDAAVAAESNVTRTADEVPRSHTLYEQHQALVAEAEETKIVVTIGALGRKAWRTLVGEHPPRKDNEADEGVGVNEDTFRDELVPLSVLSPELTDDDYDEMADVDFDRIYMTAWALNRASAASPKVLASPASLENQKNSDS